MTVGERIKEIRTKLGLSQVDFADKINVSKQTLYKYENNIITNIPSDKIEAAAALGNVSPAHLMGWDNCENSNSINNDNIAKDENERRLLMLCRNASEHEPEDKKRLVDAFESTIDFYLKTKGLKK